MSSPTRQYPNKVLPIRATSKVDLEAWMYEDFPGDPYWKNGITPKPYRWEIELIVTRQAHGDPSTRNPYAYTGEDIFVGDWITSIANGTSLKIVSILSKSDESAVCIVEDVDRYNTFGDTNGDGIFAIPDECIIFQISDMKLPILNPLPETVISTIFANEVNGRFNNNNPLYRQRVFQSNVDLKDNDTIWVDPADGTFKTIENDDQLKRMVGTVDRVGPGEDIFYFIPTTKVIEGIDPPLPGNAGSLIYSDPLTGELTTEPSTTTKISYIQLTNSVPDTTQSTNDIVIQGSVLDINNVPVTFTESTLSSVVDDINATTDQHNVSTVLQLGINDATTNPEFLGYGVCICFGLVASARINGVLVNFNIDSGDGSVSSVEMAQSINDANIPGISAEGNGIASLTIRNNNDGPILIENVTTDLYGSAFAGDISCCGVPLDTPGGGGSSTILFENKVGDGIIFKNGAGIPVQNLGLTSVRNGETPIGLVVEQSITSGSGVGSSVAVYPTLDQLPATGTVGDQAFVIDSNDGQGNKKNEWSLFLWEGFNWVKTSDEDSAGTDARTLQTDLTLTSDTETVIGTLSNDRRVTQVVIEVVTPFDDVSATLNIGDQIFSDRLMSDSLIDLNIIGSYSASSSFVYDSGNDTDIIATIDFADSTRGNVKVIITYV